MKTIKTAILVLLSIIILHAQEQKRDYPRPLNEVEYKEESLNYTLDNIEQSSIHKTNDTMNINWQKINGPYGGVITALATKGDTIIAATGMEKGIIFYSTYKGLTWQRSNFKNNSYITDIIFTDWGTVLAACGKEGLYESKDLQKWTKVVGRNLYNYYDVLFLGKDSKGGIYFAPRDRKQIIYSKDTLKTWNADFANDSLYMWDFMLADNGDLYAGGFNKMFVKRRDSLKWIECSPGYYINLGYNLAQDELGNIYAGSANRREFFESKDSGKTWIDKDTANFLHQLFYYDLTYNNGSLITAGRPDEMLSGWGIAISKDKGSTWEYSNEGLLPYSYANILATSGEDTYLGMYGGGIYRSTNQGDDWHPWMTGLAGALTYQIDVDKSGNLFSASLGEGIQRSKDNGQTWETLTIPNCNGRFYTVIVDSSYNIYAGGDDGVFVSEDNGLTWNNSLRGIILRLLNYDENTIVALDRYNGLNKSTDKGKTWTNMGGNTADAFSIIKDNKGNIYLGEDGGSIWKTKDIGATWTKVKTAYAYNHVLYDIVISKTGIIWAANDIEGLIKSADEGKTWEVVMPGRAWRVFINEKDEIFFAKQNSSTYLSDGSEVFSNGGLFCSKDEGKTWSNISGNMQYIQVNDILFKDDEIYLSTDESMFKGSLPLSIEDNKNEQIITDYSLSQNYPNPFNPSTTISFALPEAGYVTLKIYNTLGEEVTTLVNEYKQTGNHQVSFNAKDLSSGLYIYKLNASGKTFSKKMMLIK